MKPKVQTHLLKMNAESTSSPQSELRFTDLLEFAAKTKKPILFVNAYSCYLANRNSEYLNVLQNSICLIDGRPLRLFLSMFAKNEVIHTRGVDFFSSVLNSKNEKLKLQTLFGSKPQVCEAIISRVEREASLPKGLKYICPPFQSVENFDMQTYRRQILQSKSAVVWVSLGTPKQDLISFLLCRDSNAAVVSVGAAFDFYSGHKREAPRWVSRLYLEWLFRLLSEPKRLWKRYLVGNLGFLWDCFAWILIDRRKAE